MTSPSVDTRPERKLFLESLGLASSLKGPFVEIGVRHGRGTRAILEFLDGRNDKRDVYAIDPNKTKRYDKAVGDRVHDIRLCSQDPLAVAAVSGEPAWVWVDSCVCYECALADFDIWGPRIQRHGYLLIHDTDRDRWYDYYQHCTMSDRKPRRCGIVPAMLWAKGLQDFEHVRSVHNMVLLQKICGKTSDWRKRFV